MSTRSASSTRSKRFGIRVADLLGGGLDGKRDGHRAFELWGTFASESAPGDRQPSGADTGSRPDTSWVVMRKALYCARACIAALMSCLVVPAVSLASGPDFAAVTWRPLGCDTAHL